MGGIMDQITRALAVLNDDSSPVGLGETAVYETEDEEESHSGLRCQVGREDTKGMDELGAAWVKRTAKVTAIADQWPTVHTGGYLTLADGRWTVETEPIREHGLIVFDIGIGTPR